MILQQYHQLQHQSEDIQRSLINEFHKHWSLHTAWSPPTMYMLPEWICQQQQQQLMCIKHSLPGGLGGVLHNFHHLILTINPVKERVVLFHFAGEKTEAQRRKETCQKCSLIPLWSSMPPTLSNLGLSYSRAAGKTHLDNSTSSTVNTQCLS